MQAGPKKVFEPDPNQIAPKSPKIAKSSQNSAEWNKKIGLFFQNKNWQFTLVGSKNVFEPDLSNFIK